MIKLKDISLELNKLSDEQIEELLNEVMNGDISPAEEIDEKVYKFKVNGLEYKIEFTLSLTESRKSLVEFKFYLLNHPKQPKKQQFQSDREYEIALQKSMVGLTGTGNQYKVLGTIKSTLFKYINEKNPDYITFTAQEESRISLYDKLINRFINELPNYSKSNINPITGEQLTEGEFWLIKKKND